MKIATTSARLKELMDERNLRQIDILNAAKPFCDQYGVKLGKNDLSQYVSGKVEPGQEKLTILGLALNVSETWLMGYDVPSLRDFHYSSDELTDLYIRGAKKWATDFRFSEDQRTRISEYLAESTLRLKNVINMMAASSQSDGKILMSSALQSALDSLTYWSANAVKYVNEDLANEPYEGMLLELFRQIPENRQPLVFGMIRAAIEADQEMKGPRE